MVAVDELAIAAVESPVPPRTAPHCTAPLSLAPPLPAGAAATAAATTVAAAVALAAAAVCRPLLLLLLLLLLLE
jgi:hypothetical protein